MASRLATKYIASRKPVLPPPIAQISPIAHIFPSTTINPITDINPSDNTLVIITGPTGIGKTATAIKLAKRLQCEIISADSRQIYRDLPIGTAAPTPEEMKEVVHHFVGTLPLDSYYSAAKFEEDVLKLLPRLWQKSPYAVMCGGSMMYVDSVVNGIDFLPDVSPEIRQRSWDIYYNEGLEALQRAAAKLDPAYYATADPSNYKRLVHAIEITLQAGRPYSSFLTGEKRERPFRILKFAMDMPREQLFDRINRRVELMIEAGLEEEARRVYPRRHLNSLNTVGYKEMFAIFDGTTDRRTAIERLKKNTRVYAKKQLTWLRRDPSVIWLTPEEANDTEGLVRRIADNE